MEESIGAIRGRTYARKCMTDRRAWSVGRINSTAPNCLPEPGPSTLEAKMHYSSLLLHESLVEHQGQGCLGCVDSIGLEIETIDWAAQPELILVIAAIIRDQMNHTGEHQGQQREQ
ncbi:MAG: hypothetical protein WA970_21870, partial [Gammaproteobacteria bacterium]